MKEGRDGKGGKEREKYGGIEVQMNGVREEAGWRGRRMDIPIFKNAWLRHCTALSVYCFYFDAF